MKAGLRNAGWSIETVGSGEAALEMFREQPFDVIVSDERMPGMQGADLLTIIRHEFPATLRLTLSGQGSLKQAVHAINSAEIHRFLIKPCPPSEVQATIEELLDKYSEQDARARSRDEIEARERESLTAVFEAALDAMWMAFQPIWDRDGRLYGYEALLRTDLADVRGPCHFFDIAESLGRSNELGARTREVVAREIERAPEQVLILVNVHPDHLSDAGLYEEDSPLSKHADRVIIEVTERSSMSSNPDLSDSLERLGALGYLLAVDDLGAGYAGLNRFSLLNPAIVKFDMELIRNIDRSPTKQAVVQAMTYLCETLGILSIAEGIETEAEYEMAHSLGCDLYQGFLLGSPGRGFAWARSRRAA